MGNRIFEVTACKKIGKKIDYWVQYAQAKYPEHAKRIATFQNHENEIFPIEGNHLAGVSKDS